MSLPKPNCSFIIPSIHDDLELDCRIYYPRRTERNFQTFGRGFAVFAHPYAPLGGCYDDPVVGLACGVLLLNGYVVTTFNFRGASGSAGRTSWSSKAELDDYVSVYGFLLCYIDAIYRPLSEERNVSGGSSILILGGYSYGSMIASHLPALDVVLDLFKSPPPGSAKSEIRFRAEDLSRDARAYLEMHSVQTTLNLPRTRTVQGEESKKPSRSVIVGGYESDAASRRVSRKTSPRSIDGDRIRRSLSFDRVRRKINSPASSASEPAPCPPTREVPAMRPKIAYVLVSPILSTAAGFTTLFSKLKFSQKDREIAPPAGGEFHELTLHPCCCVYGSRDAFTSARKLQRWVNELQSQSGSRFLVIRAETGHFWQEADAVVRLQQGLGEFLKTLGMEDRPV